MRVIEDHQGRITLDTRVILTEFKSGFAEIVTRVSLGMERLICGARGFILRRGVLTLRWSFAAEAAGLGLARKVSL